MLDIHPFDSICTIFYINYWLYYLAVNEVCDLNLIDLAIMEKIQVLASAHMGFVFKYIRKMEFPPFPQRNKTGRYRAHFRPCFPVVYIFCIVILIVYML